jgi:NADH-ubiquinone oxidoreductase chain 5
LSFVAFYEVILCNSPVSIELFTWINLEHLNISWSFYFDELTVSMLIPVLIVSVLVHIYSVGYNQLNKYELILILLIQVLTC